MAFRYRYEISDFPGAGNKKIGAYCHALNSQLDSADKARAVFDEVNAIVQLALKNLSLGLERDNAKSRTLIDETRRLATGRNPISGAVQATS